MFCVSFIWFRCLPMFVTSIECIPCVLYLQCPKLFGNVFPMRPKSVVTNTPIYIPVVFQSIAGNFCDSVRPLVVLHGTTIALDLLDSPANVAIHRTSRSLRFDASALAINRFGALCHSPNGDGTRVCHHHDVKSKSNAIFDCQHGE